MNSKQRSSTPSPPLHRLRMVIRQAGVTALTASFIVCLAGCSGGPVNVAAVEGTHQSFNEAEDAFAKGEYQVAVTKYTESIAAGYLNPDQHAKASVQLGIALGHVDKIDEGLQAIDKAAAGISKREYHQARATAYKASGNEAAATEELKAAGKR